MNQLIFALKREYWECKRQLVLVPLIVTALFFLATLVATWTHNDPASELLSISEGTQVELSNSAASSSDTAASDPAASTPAALAPAALAPAALAPETKKENTFWFSGVYLLAAWLAAMFYALSSLYNDRRDNSILYWKTMPVSELQTVLAKLVFAVIGFSFAAIVISWLSAVVLMSYAHLVLPPEMQANNTNSMNFAKLVVWPVLASLVALVWCAPVFALLLYVSARAKKMPILMLLVSVIVVGIVERLVFSSDYVFAFLLAHSPFGLISEFAKMGSAAEFLQTYLVSSFASLVLGLLIAGVLVWRAVWRRNYDFEL